MHSESFTKINNDLTLHSNPYLECLRTRHFMYVTIIFQNRDSKLILWMKQLSLCEPRGASKKYCMITESVRLANRGHAVAAHVSGFEVSRSRYPE